MTLGKIYSSPRVGEILQKHEEKLILYDGRTMADGSDKK